MVRNQLKSTYENSFCKVPTKDDPTSSSHTQVNQSIFNNNKKQSSMMKMYSTLRAGKFLAAFLIAMALTVFSFQKAGAQNVVVTYTGGGGGTVNYNTSSALATAISDINSGGMTGAITCTVNSSYSETAPSGGYVITATGTAVNPIVFTRSSTSSRPVITAPVNTAGSSTDAVFKIVGGDYITIDGFAIQENSSNTVTATGATNTMTEMGIGLFLQSATNGAQNNTIKNNTISLNGNYPNSFGILSTSSSSSTNAALAATATTGTNSNNAVYSNTISNTNFGIYVICQPLTSTINESGWNIGAAGQGNNITCYYTATANTAIFTGMGITNNGGVIFRNGAGFTASSNTVTNSLAFAVSSTNVFIGIGASSATAPVGITYTTTISNNNITLTESASSTGATSSLNAIDFGHGISTGTIVSSSNTITLTHTGSYTTAGAATLNGIKANYTAAAITANSNTVGITYTVNTTGALGNTPVITGVNIAGTTTGANTANNNNVTVSVSHRASSSAAATSVAGSSIGISMGAAATITATGNTISNTQLLAPSTAFAHALSTSFVGISSAVVGTTVNINSNNITITQTNSLSTGATAITISGAQTGITAAAGSANVNTNNNTVTITQNCNPTGNTTALATISSSATGITSATTASGGNFVGKYNNIKIIQKVNNTSTGAASATIASGTYVGISVGGSSTNVSGSTVIQGDTILYQRNLSQGALHTVTVSSGTCYGIQQSSGTSLNSTIGSLTVAGDKNIVQFRDDSVTTGTMTYGAATHYYIYTVGGHANQKVWGNIINNGSTVSTATGAYDRTTSTVYGIYHSQTIATSDSLLNNVINIDRSRAIANTAATYGMYTFGGSSITSNYLQAGNNITLAVNNSTSGTTYGFFNADGGTPTKNINNNTINISGNPFAAYGMQVGYGTVYIGAAGLPNTINISSGNANAGVTLVGIFGYSTGINWNASYNNINSIVSTAGGSASPIIKGITGNTTSGVNNFIFNNTITGLSAATSSGSATITGIEVSVGNINHVANNKIYGLAALSTGASTLVSGLLISGGSTNGFYYNNVIGGLTSPASTNPEGIRGISITSSAAGTAHRVYNNTVYLNASSTGVNFGSTGIFHASNTTAINSSLVLRNNIINNNSTAAGTGLTVAFRRDNGVTANTLNNYGAASDKNIFYAGVPSATNLIYYDGTNAAQSLSDYQTYSYGAGTIAPRDAASQTENTVFASTTGSDPNFLAPSTAGFTYAESGAGSISTATGFVFSPSGFAANGLGTWKRDITGALRQDTAGYTGFGTAPDMGAYEINNGSSVFVLSDNPSGQTVAQNISLNTTDNILHQAQLQVAYGTGVLSSVSFVLNGTSTYTSSDISNFHLYYTTTNTFATTNSLGTVASTSTGSGETVTFSGLTTSLPAGVYYLWLTGDVASTGTVGRTVLVNALSASSITTSTANATIASASATTISGVQTLANPCTGSPSAGTAAAIVTTVCPNGTTTLSLTGTTVGTGISYEWHSSRDNFVVLDSVLGTNPTQITVPSASAPYYYSCKVTCATTGQSSFSNTVTVNVYQTAVSINANNAAQYCGYKNNPVQLAAVTAGATPSSIVWTPIDSLYTNNPASTRYTANANAATVYAAPAAATTYTATANYSNIGCASTSATKTVTIGAKVIINSVAASNNPVCVGSSSVFTAVTTVPASVAFQETFDGAFPQSGWTFINAGTGNAWTSTVTTAQGAGAINCTWNGTNAANAWAITPGVALTAGVPYKVRFYYRVGGSFVEQFKATVGTGNTVADQTTKLWDNGDTTGVTAGASFSTPTTYTVAQTRTFTPSSTGSYYFGFNCYSIANQNTVYLDSITIIYPTVANYAWSPSTNLTGANTQTATFTMPTGTTNQYAYTFTLSTSAGCSASTLAGDITTPSTNTITRSTSAPVINNSGILTGKKKTSAYTTITDGATVCPADTVVLRVPGIAGGCAPFTYQWIKNDDGTVYSTSDSLRFPAVANASVGTPDYFYVNITDAQGNPVQSQFFTLNITDNPFSLASTPANAVICGTGSVSLAVSGYNASPVFNWSPSTGLSATTGTSVTASPSATTTYSVTSTLSGCVSPAKTVTVNVSPVPQGVAAISSAPSVCSGGTVNLSGTATNGGSVGGTATGGKTRTNGADGSNTGGGIYFTANSTFTLASVEIYPTASGTMTIQLLPGSTTSGTPVQSYNMPISAGQVNTWVTVPLNFTNIAPGDYTLYNTGLSAWRDYSAGLPATSYPYTNLGGVATLTGGTLSGYYYFFYNWVVSTVVTIPVTSWAWSSTPAGYTSTAQNPTGVGLVSNATTQYTVKAFNSFGCSSTANVTVTLGGGTPTASAAQVSGTASGCYNRNVVLKASVTGGCSPFTYQWMLNGTPLTNGGNIDGATSDSLKITGIQANQAGNYSVKITDNGSLNSTSSDVAISVLTPGVVSIAATQTALCGNQTTQLTVTGGATGAARTWTPITGLYRDSASVRVPYIAGKDTNVVVAKISANTTYTVSTTDNNGCTVTASQALVYGSNQTLSITATASPLSVCAGNTSSLTSTFVNQLLANTYTFGATTGASLDPMVNDTTICLANDDDYPNANVAPTTIGNPFNIGFTFTYEGVPYTQFSASPDGWIRLGGTTPATSFTNAITTATQIPALIAYWDDLATGSDGRVSYVVTGTAPNRILKVNWKVTIPRNTTGASNSQFQIWVYETSNKVEYRYGTMGSAAMSASVGLIGAVATNFLSVSLASNTASINTANDANSIQPASGTMYTFTPLAPATKVTWAPVTAELSSGTGNTVTFNMPNSGANSSYSYTPTVTDTITGCYAVATSPVVVSLATGAPVITSVTKSQDNVCKSTGRPTTLSANITNGCAPYSYRWKLSGASTYFDSTINTNASVATTIVSPTVTTSYVVDIVDNNGAVATGTNTTTLTLVNPTPISTTGTTICGSGIPTVSAVANSGNSIVWYDSLTGGNFLGAGSSYTPSSAISATTTYYAAENSTGATYNNVGYTNYIYYSYTTSLNTYGIQFDANSYFTLNSVKVYPIATTDGTSGSVTIALTNAAGTVLQSKVVSVTGYTSGLVAANGQDVNLGFSVVPGTGYRLVMTAYSGITGLAYYYNYPNNLGFPFTDAGNNISITNTTLGGTAYNYYWYYFWNWSITAGCVGQTRLPAVATVNPKSTVVLSNNNQITTQAIAPGTNDNIISTGTLTVSNNSTTLSALSVGLVGNYAASDISNFKLRYSATNTLVSATTLGTVSSTMSTGAESLSFTGLNTALPIGTYYIWLTADIASGATINDTLKVNAITASGLTLTGCNNASTGTISATGAQSIVNGCSGTPAAVTFATPSYTACTGATAPTITGTNNNGNVAGFTYQWYSCDDASGTNPVAIFGATLLNYKPANYTSAGTYYYYVTASCYFSGLSTNSAVVPVVVTTTPTLSLGVSPSATICGGSTVTITDANYVSGYTYSWTPNTSNTTQSATVTPSVTTKYKVVATNNGCASKADSVTITVTATPTVDSVRSSAAATCTGTTVDLKSYASAGGYVSTSEGFEGATFPPTGWTLINAGSGNNWVSTTPTNHTTGGSKSMRYSYSTSAAANAWAMTPAYNLVAGNTYTVSVWYGSSYGGTSYNEKFDVTVGNAPTVAAQTTKLFSSGNVNSSQSTWLNGTVTFSPPTTGTYYFGFNCNSITNQGYLELDDITISGGPVITGYSWASTPAGFSSSVQNPSGVTVASTGTNTYSVTVTNNFGCTATGSVSVTGNPLPAAPTATNDGTTTCGTPTFTLSSNSGVGSPVYAWFNASTGGTAIAGQTASSYSPATFAVGNNSAWASEVSAQGCLSTRTQSTITVTTPDDFALATHSATLCAGVTSLALAPTVGTASNYSSVTWTPITGLYTDAGCTVPYTTGANYATVYVKPATFGSVRYTAYATGANGGNSSCVNSDTVRIDAQAPIAITAQPVGTSTCGSINKTLTVSATSAGPITYQWQSSVDSTNWSNIANGTPSGTTYTGAATASLAITALNTSYYYRTVLSNGICSNVNTNAALIFAGTPSITSIVGDSTCQPVASISNLAANPSTGASTRWYATNVSTTVLSNGTTYSTPALATTTTYYAEPYVNYTGATSNVGLSSYTYYSYSTGTGSYGMQFNALSSVVLNSVVVYPYATTDGTPGSITIQLKNSAGTVLNTVTTNVVGYSSGTIGAHAQTVNLGFTVPAGTGYQLVLGAYSGISGLAYYYNSGLNLGYPFTDAANSISLTGGLSFGTAYNYYNYYFWNFNVTPQYTCIGTRVPVTAKRNTAPTISVSGTATKCSGLSFTLSASSSNPGYKYTWTPNDGSAALVGASQTVTPSTTTAYALTALDTSNGTYTTCFGSGSALAVVAKNPTTVTVNASPTQLCGGGTTGLTLTGGVTAGMNILSEPFEIASPVFSNTSGATISQSSTYFTQGGSAVRIAYGNSLSSSTAGTYEINQNIDLSKFATSGTDTVTLSFKQICATEQASDYGYVEYSTNGGTTWTAFASNTYRGSGVKKNGVVSFDASSYTDWNTTFTSVNSVPTNSLWKTETIKVPFAAYTSQFRVRFRVVSNATNTYYGWLIDDVKLTGGTATRTFAWANNTGAAFTNYQQQSPNVSPVTTTSYNVTVTNGYGCTATAASPVTVTYLASSVQGTPTASTTVFCNNGTTTLSQTGGSLSAGAYWAWYTNASFGSQYLIDTTSDPTATFSTSLSNTTSYYLRAEGTSTCSNTGGSFVTVTVNKTSVAPISASVSNATICGSTSVTLTQSGGTLGAGASWKWYSDAAFTTLVGTSSAANGSLTTTLSTTTTFYVRAEGGTAPCSTTAVTAAASVTVNLVSNVQGTAQASVSAVCNSGSVTLTQTGGSLGTGATWKWYSNPTFTTLVGSSTAADASVTTTVATTTKTFYLRAEGNVCGATAGSSVTVTVNASSIAPTSASASNPIICGSTSETLTQTGGTLGTGATWKWYSDAGFTTLVGSSSSANASFVTTTAVTKTYYVRAEGSTAPCANTPSAAASVTVTLNSSVSAAISGDYAVCQGASVPKTISIAFGGFGPWNVTYTDGTTPVTVNNISTSPYTFNVSPATTKTYTITSVNAGTGCNGTTSGSATYTVNALPVATATPASQNVCSGSTLNINFGTSNNVSGTTYTWTRNNTSAATGIAASGSSFVSGTLTNASTPTTVTFTITPTGPAPTSCPGTPTTATVTVYNPATAYNVTGGGAYCSLSGSGVPVGLSNTQTGYDYQLLLNGTPLTATSVSVAGNPLNFGNQTAAGTYTVLAANAGCSTPMTGSATVTITTPTTPSVDLVSGSTTACGGTNVSFLALAFNGGSAPTYDFLVNGVSKQNGLSNGFITSTLSDGDVVSCIVTSNASCQTTSTATSNNITMTITGGATLVAPKPITGVTTNCTVGSSNFLKDSTSGGVWSSSDTTVAKIISSGLVTGRKNGIAVINYTISGANGCKNIASAVYVVAEQDAPAPIATVSGATSVCTGSTITLTSATPGGTWASLNNAATVNPTTGVVTGSYGATYNAAITYKTTNVYGCSKTATYNGLKVNPNPGVPTIQYAPGTPNPQNGPGGAYCLNKGGVPNTFTVVGAGAAGSGAGTGVWTSSNPAVVTIGATTGLVQLVSFGTSIMTYTFTNANGCKNSRSMTGTVVNCPNSRGVDYVAPKAEMDFTMYPNPAKGTVAITADYVQSGGQIIVTDMFGKQVKVQALSLGVNRLDINNLSKGFYLVNVITTEGNKTKKLIVE